MTTSRLTMLRDAIRLIGLGVGVTVGGLFIGAAVVSPALSPEQRLLGIGVLGGIAAMMLAVRQVIRRRRARPTRSTRKARQAPAPAIVLRGTKAARTPRAVAALAAAGAAPIEIAWKTGLPVDAVSMLLEISGSRMSAA